MAARYIALIPAYEPDRRMLGVIADLGKQGFDIVLVDDGSGPEYSDLFEQAAERLPGKSGRGVTLLIHDTNRGKGAALRTGLDFISNFMVIRGEERQNVIVTVDADGQHLAKDVIRTACAAESEPGALILGSRWSCLSKTDTETVYSADQSGAEGARRSDAPLRSRFGNAVTREVFRMATGTEIYDTQTGLRAFTADLIPELLRIRGDRYEYEINMLMEFVSEDIPVEEVGIETVYLDGNESSHFNTLKDSYRIYREIAAYTMAGKRKSTGRETAGQALKFSVSSFASFLIDYAVYALLLLIGPGLIFANIGARIISSAANYTINRKLVFRSGSSLTTSALQYFVLAAFILAGNTIVLDAMVGTLGIGSMVAKILTEMLFFLISWTVQKYVIFYSGEAAAGSQGHVQHGAAELCTGDLPCREAEGYCIEYSAVRPKKLRDAYRKGERRA